MDKHMVTQILRSNDGFRRERRMLSIKIRKPLRGDPVDAGLSDNVLVCLPHSASRIPEEGLSECDKSDEENGGAKFEPTWNVTGMTSPAPNASAKRSLLDVGRVARQTATTICLAWSPNIALNFTVAKTPPMGHGPPKDQ